MQQQPEQPPRSLSGWTGRSSDRDRAAAVTAAKGIPPPPPSTNNSMQPQYHNSSTGSQSAASTSTSNTSSMINNTRIKPSSLHGNLMRRQFRDPMTIYEIVKELGQGSMGSVAKVRKRDHAIGGSANPDFVQQQQNECCFSLLSWFQQWLPTAKQSALQHSTNEDNEDHSINEQETCHVPTKQPQPRPNIENNITASSALSSGSSDVQTNSEHSQGPFPLQRSLWDEPLGDLSIHDKDRLSLQLALPNAVPPPAPPRHQHCHSLTSLPSSLQSSNSVITDGNTNDNVHPLKRPPRRPFYTPPVPHHLRKQHPKDRQHGHRKTSSALIRYNTTTTDNSLLMDTNIYNHHRSSTHSTDHDNDSVASSGEYWQRSKRKSERFVEATVAAALAAPAVPQKAKKKDVFYALKTIHLSHCTSNVFRKELMNEVEILKEMDHPNIARAIETFVYKERLYLTLELCSGGDLYARDPYTEQQAGKILQSLFSAVSYMHFKGIVHRDLKYENIMFVDPSPDAEIKLIDFGLSKKYAGFGFMKEKVGTIYTMAPELLSGKYDAKADVWSLGIIAFMLLSSSMPFHGKTRVRIMEKTLKEPPSFTSKRWDRVSQDARQFVDAMLEKVPEQRPSAEQGLKLLNSWLSNQGFSKPPEPPVCSPPASSMDPSSLLPCEVSHDVELLDRIQASIQAFAQYRLLKKLVLMVVAYKSTTEEIGFLRNMFRRFDSRQTGVITREDFTNALLAVYEYTTDEIGALFDALDVCGSGLVGYSEFLAATLEAHGLLEEDRLAEAFDRIDADSTGYITVDNLRDFLGNDVPLQYLENIMDEAELSDDRRIYYGEFLNLWNEQDDMKLKRAKQQVQIRRHNRSLSNCDSILSNLSFREEDVFGEQVFQVPLNVAAQHA